MSSIPLIRTHRRWLAAAGLLLMPALAACSSDDPSTVEAAPTANAPAGATFNDADVKFAQGMIPHHEQAIEMAELALDPTSSPSDKIRELAVRIRGAQDPEVKKMRGWLKAWGKDEITNMADHSQHGMLEPKDLTALDALTGVAFNRRFAALMIQHHEGAVTMSETLKATGTNPEVRALADAIITAQKAEIDELRPLTTA